jgi:hypothetical protein
MSSSRSRWSRRRTAVNHRAGQRIGAELRAIDTRKSSRSISWPRDGAVAISASIRAQAIVRRSSLMSLAMALSGT